MNPPSALHGAMGRERKPFTYTPGGLNLSEIKSERMAKRLMRNAMNQGVPETPAQKIQSPPVSSNKAIPNFNCLPVQVFPTFNLPSNPKTLLRTRSHPEQPREPIQRKVAPPPEAPTNFMPYESNFNRAFNYNNNGNQYTPSNNNFNVNTNYNVNNNNSASMYDYNRPASNIYDPMRSYGSHGHTMPLLPEKSYDAEYFQVPPQGPRIVEKIDTPRETIDISKTISQIEPKQYVTLDILEKPVTNEVCAPIEIEIKPLGETMATDDDQKEVKIVKKEVNQATVTQNQNGDASAAVTVKLPGKKTGAKTETRVEIENKILPDGTVEETKTTTTKTTIDGKSEIATKIEKRILSKEEADAVIEIEEEEEEEEVEENGEDASNELKEEIKESVVVETKEADPVKNEEVQESEEIEEEVVEQSEKEEPAENGVIIKQEERQEVTTTKKVVVIQSEGDEEEEEIEEVEEEEDAEEVVIKREPEKDESVEKEEVVEEYNIKIETKDTESAKKVIEEETIEVAEKEEEESKDEVNEEAVSKTKDEEDEIDDEQNKKQINEDTPVTDNVVTKEKEDEEEIEEEEEYEEAEENEVEEKLDVKQESVTIKDEVDTKNESEPKIAEQEVESKTEEIPIKVIIETKVDTPVETEKPKEESEKPQNEKLILQPEQKLPYREPSIPLEKVEDVEIKPIGAGKDYFTKSLTHNTEIITTSTDKPLGALSTQTEYNRIENIVTVNRTTKTLDNAYEQMIQPTVPTIKTYFAPPNRDSISISPQPARPYQPVYPPEQSTERRHSLLLERLSMERQLPPAEIYQNNYQYTNQGFDDQQQEPQSEVLTVSNVKPSTITKNQQWYQQTKKENVTYNNVTPTPTTPSQLLRPQSQPEFQPQPQIYQPPPQAQYQPPPQTQYQPSPQPQFKPAPQAQFLQQQYQPPPQVQSTYTENIAKDSYKSTTNNYTQNIYSNYPPKSTTWASNVDNQNSFLKSDSTDTYQKSNQQYSSSYVPPPWEQDSNYVSDTINQNYYQPPPLSSTFNTGDDSKVGWKPSPPAAKFSKPTPTSYIPPAPNQSFVKPVINVEPPKLPGRKTYYSEYERRYISVPESTYIPTETKYQAQPDPSPKYYYDNNEPVETVEPQWRKELREFTEKTSQTTVQTETSVRPPWEEEPKYVKPDYVPTPTWSQTLKPQSWRERSFESEYIGSKEWPKTNTLGRGRPQSSYVKSGFDSPIPERTRGVSVDRYNPNSYQSPIPSEHPPVQSHTLNVQATNYHNPNVPAYHARAAAENREQSASIQQQRQWGESRATPIQSRSFKYLQWITGTED